MVVRNIFERGKRVRLAFPKGEGRARQEMAKECDINQIMRRFVKTGAIDHFSKHSPFYGDFDAMDFHSAQNVLAKAKEMFADLPSDLRKELGDDPAAFLEYVGDSSNLEALERRGMLREGNSVQVAREAAEAAAEAVLAASVVVPDPPVGPPEGGPGTVPT